MEGLKKQDGNAIVEATIVFPVIIMIIIVLFYAALFLCQRANLQANLQTALIYYKNVETDTNVVVDQSGSASILNLHASRYSGASLESPYRNFFMTTKGQEGNFKTLFNIISGQMFFANVSDVNVEYETRNYIIYQDITATATQVVEIPVDFKLLGIDPKLTLATEARVVITDPDEFAHTTQLVADFVSDTKLGDAIKSGEAKISAGYDKLKEVLHID